MAKLSVIEQLMFSTTRITTLCTDGKSYSASGFFYQYELEKNGDKELIPVIITNKHVTEKAELLNVFMSRSDDQGNPLYEPPYGIQFHKKDLDKFVIHHPNPNVDLSLIFALPIIESFKAENKKGILPDYPRKTNSKQRRIAFIRCRGGDINGWLS